MHDLAAVLPRAGPDIDDPVGRTNRVFVVFDDDERVSEVAQLFERLDQAAVVALVQADRRLVEHVEHAREAGTDLRGEADALGLAPREAAGRAREVEVGEPHFGEELEARAKFAQHLGADLRLALREVEVGEEVERIVERHERRVGDGLAGDRDREHLGAQARAVARWAGHLTQVLRPAVPLRVGLGLGELPFDVGDDALEARRVRDLTTEAVAVLHPYLEILAVQQRLLHVLRKLAPRRVEVETELFGNAEQQSLVVLVKRLTLRRPRQNRTLDDRGVGVTNHQVFVDGHANTEAIAGGACAERRVKRERARLDLGQREGVAVRAREVLRERLFSVVALGIDVLDRHSTLRQP